MSFLKEALKGAKADIDSAGGDFLPRLARAARVARVLGLELAAIVSLAPYGAYAMSIYRRLTALPPPPPPAGTGTPTSASPPAPSSATTSTTTTTPSSAPVSPDYAAALRALPLGRDGVALARQVPYGPALRNVLDIYLPLRPPPSPPAPAPGRENATAHTKEEEEVGKGGGVLLPVVFFLHGGVWASGETWQYAPMATRLAQQGVLVVVPTYTLYPEALAGTMVEEVSAALSWTFDNVRRYGGDPGRITANGHSAGGHLLAWALLRRAAAAEAVAAATAAPTTTTSLGPPMSVSMAKPAAAVPSPASAPPHASVPSSRQPEQQRRRTRREQEEEEQEEPQGSAAHASDRRDTAAYLLGGAGPSLPGALHALRAVADVQLHPQPGVDVESSYDGSGTGGAAAAAAARPPHREVDTRMPAVFVGMSSVYDIAKHYEFEKARAVHELSMMKRAVGGPAGFAAASPSVILARAVAEAQGGEAGARVSDGVGDGGGSSGSGNGFTDFFHSYELLGDAITARAGLVTDRGAGASRGSSSGANGDCGSSSNSSGGVAEPRFTLAAARHLPPCVVMGSCADHMVPWHEGAELVGRLSSCGVPVRHLLYNHVGHGDFVMAWRPLDVRQPQHAHHTGHGNGNGRSGPAHHAGSAARSVSAGLDLSGLLPCARDLVLIATGRVQAVGGGGGGRQQRGGSGGATADKPGDSVDSASARQEEEAEEGLVARSRL